MHIGAHPPSSIGFQLLLQAQVRPKVPIALKERSSKIVQMPSNQEHATARSHFVHLQHHDPAALPVPRLPVFSFLVEFLLDDFGTNSADGLVISSSDQSKSLTLTLATSTPY